MAALPTDHFLVGLEVSVAERGRGVGGEPVTVGGSLFPRCRVADDVVLDVSRACEGRLLLG